MFATTAALLTGNKNMSVIYANLGGANSPEITLFFAAIHVPIYAFPWFFQGVYHGAVSGWHRTRQTASKWAPGERQHRPGLQQGR
jgi:hypothetical protein